MNRVNQSFKILSPNIEADLYLLIEKAGRICYKSGDPEKQFSDEKSEDFIRRIIRSGHESVLEHATISVLVTTNRGVTHEWVRHRAGSSYSQESTRYCNYDNGKFGSEITVIDIMAAINADPKCRNMSDDEKSEIYQAWKAAMNAAEHYYMKMIELGATPQIARDVLPNSTKAEIVCTHNIREWRLIFKLRTPMAAHPEMRIAMVPLLKHFKMWFPAFFEDIEVPEL